MARWKATYRRPNRLDDYLYFNAADARSMSPLALKKADDNAKRRASERLAKKGVTDAVIVRVNCVG